MITPDTMVPDIAPLFSPLRLSRITLKNRLLRSATYEGMGDACGLPRPELAELYLALARGGVGTIISGFVFVSQTVRAIRRSCGEDFPVLVKLSAADDSSPGVRVDDTIRTVQRLEACGVDAVEISYGTMEFALNIIRGACPVDLVLRVNPLFNRIPPFVRGLWKRFRAGSYTARFMPFEENYNAALAARIKAATSLPVIVVGGVRTRAGIEDCLTRHGLDGVSLCRPLIAEPDWPLRLRNGQADRSSCTNCNLCTIYGDSNRSLRCYGRRKEHDHAHSDD